MNQTLLTLVVLFVMLSAKNQKLDTINLWPNNVPGQVSAKASAKFSSDLSNNVLRISEVTNPLLVLYKPKQPAKSDLCVIVCPGGGYQILAIDLEGYEIATWLSSLGITVYVLQYRVPGNPEGALQDLQRSIRVVRHLNPNQKIGLMGFSAGGSLSVRASTCFDTKTYEPVDAIDTLCARPDFTALIYPAYLDEGKNRSLTPELTITDATPPMFLFATLDDFYANSALVMTTAMRDHNRPAELHLLDKGGHGYGLRKGNIAAETWPGLLEKWLNKNFFHGSK